MRKRSSKPRDVNQVAKAIVDEAAAEAQSSPSPQLEPQADGKNPAAVALGRLGGKKGGPARAAKLSAKTRSKIARKAALARWSKGGS